jgi:periplasmic copper chaperone A
MSFTRRAAVAAILSVISIAALAPHARAHDYKLGSLSIGHPWARATPPAARVGAGYFTVTNNGSQPDRLISAKFVGSETVELHEMTNEAGVMRMRELRDGYEILPGQKLELKPGGFHLMFMGLKAGLAEGQSVKGELVFQRAGRVEIEFKVEAMGARQNHDHGHHGHGAPKTN